MQKSFESFMEDALLKSLPELTLTRLAEKPDLSKSLTLMAMLDVNSKDLKAQSFIIASAEFLQKTCPLPGGSEDHTTLVIKDWLGELGNLIMGRLKNRLLAHNITIKISAPRFDSAPKTTKNSQSITLWFQAEQSFIGFECFVEGTIPKIGDEIKQTAEILPGDAIYRLNDPVNAPPSYDLISKIRSNPSDQAESDDCEETVDELEALASDDDLETQAPVPPPAKASGSVRLLFHSNSKAPSLVGVSWSQSDRLLLQFRSGLEYAFCPTTLLDAGTASFEVEGLTVTFAREGDVIKASIPKLNMHFSKSTRAA
ncbi:MAG: hypothetical protein H7249_00670 [Chitinophagaceae bacterium]|nr:hypothetical protein [Oligoflexus sp.]